MDRKGDSSGQTQYRQYLQEECPENAGHGDFEASEESEGRQAAKPGRPSVTLQALLVGDWPAPGAR